MEQKYKSSMNAKACRVLSLSAIYGNRHSGCLGSVNGFTFFFGHVHQAVLPAHAQLKYGRICIQHSFQ